MFRLWRELVLPVGLMKKSLEGAYDLGFERIGVTILVMCDDV